MNIAVNRNNRNQIRTLLLIGSLIYFSFGFFILDGFEADKIAYWRYAAVSCLLVILSGMLHMKRFDKYAHLPSMFVIFANFFSASNVLFQPLEFCSSPIYYLSIIIIMTALIDTSAMLSKRLAYVNIAVVVLLFLAQSLRAQALFDISIFGPIIVFLAWQTAMVINLIEMFDQIIDTKQLDAYKATIIMLNHEFNNVNTICLFLIDRIKSREGGPSQDDLNSLQENILRLSSLIQQVRHQKRFKEVSYVDGGAPMFSLE